MELNRLRWASRRGMLELDLVLLPFVENVYSSLEEGDKQRFDQLLEAEDQDLFRWFLGKEIPPDEDAKRIVGIVLEHTGLGAKR